MDSGSCRRCHRALKDPASRKRGLGPICARKDEAERRRSERVSDTEYWPFSNEKREQKIYRGKRGGQLSMMSQVGLTAVAVSDGSGTRALHHYRKHSPSGFEWGFAGSGPAELARCILIDALGLKVRKTKDTPTWSDGEAPKIDAFQIYQKFKFAFIGTLGDEWEITHADVIAWYEREIARKKEDEQWQAV